MTSPSDVLQMVKDNDVKFVDYRLTDTRGREQHVSVPAHQLTEETTPTRLIWIRSVNRTR